MEVGRIIPGKTLLFLDEIQACPRAIMALRYFYEQLPELHVVAAGSLLEFAFGEISIPVELEIKEENDIYAIVLCCYY